MQYVLCCKSDVPHNYHLYNIQVLGGDYFAVKKFWALQYDTVFMMCFYNYSHGNAVIGPYSITFMTVSLVL
jgi:hypothetical protein